MRSKKKKLLFSAYFEKKKNWNKVTLNDAVKRVKDSERRSVD